MSINELDLILKKDPIISTWAARYLQEQPNRVETDYLVHAKTHLSLGDTSKYVDTTFKWVGGVNKGTFIGAVLGEYGEGKTSFLVHLWSESQEQKICAVPPFEWSKFEDIVDAIAGWCQYILNRDTRADLAKKVEHIYQKFRQQNIEELAQEAAKEENNDYERALDTIKTLINQGAVHLSDMSADRLLDFVAKVSDVVNEGGYNGLLILLDEPEVAAKKLGNETVQHFLFNLANELHQRRGNYGVFVSLPANFYALAQNRFSALTARFEIRNCFPRLSDIYGSDFAERLWERYIIEFKIGNEDKKIINSLALQSVGQLGSSDYRELSYGPRSVISVFRRMVDVYKATNEPYNCEQLIQDVLDQEILVKPEYRSKLHSVFNSPLVNEDNRYAITILAAFPAGLRQDIIDQLELENALQPLARTDGLVYRTAYTMGLRELRKQRDGVSQVDPLRDMIEEIDSEYVPNLQTFNNAIKAFSKEFIPLIFQTRKGHQLENWQTDSPIKKEFERVYFGTLLGAFEQTSIYFPYRAVLLLIRGSDDEWKRVKAPILSKDAGPQKYDLFFQIVLRWNDRQPKAGNIVEIQEQKEQPILIHINLDLTKKTLRQDKLAELVGAKRLTPLWVLNLIERLQKAEFPRNSEIEWQALQRSLINQFLKLFFDSNFTTELIQFVKANFQEQLNGSGLQLLDRLTNLLLNRRYPEYSTLIRQPRWQSQVDNYINALTSNEIPLSCKRGREPWLVDETQKDLAARTLGTSRANLSGGAFSGFDNLITITSKGRTKPLEIKFLIHPLEEKIREIIMSQPKGANRKFKRSNKEGWYISKIELLPRLIGNGYTLDELKKLIEIGKARQTFLETKHKREEVLYCLPLDPDELKDQLQAKLTDLAKEIEMFKQLPDYQTSFDIVAVKEKINSIVDDTDYERLMTRMNKEFEQNHNRLPGYFDRTQEKFKMIQKRVQEITNCLIDSREYRQLKVPSAKSSWGNTLGRYIVQNLRQEIEDFDSKSKKLLDRLKKCKAKFQYSSQHKPQENLSLLLDGEDEKDDLEVKSNDLLNTAKGWGQKLKDYQYWCKLLKYSDNLYMKLLELKQKLAYEAEELIKKFDAVSSEIEEFIEMRNIAGLSSYSQFQKKFEEIEEKRQNYLRDLRKNFENRKNSVNQLIQTMQLGERIKTAFNPLNMAESYINLYKEGVKTIQERGLEQSLSELKQQKQELLYAQDILRSITNDEAQTYIAGICEKQQSIRELRDTVTQDWLRQVIENDDQTQVEAISQTVVEAFETSQKTRRKVREITKPILPTEEHIKKMYEIIPDHGDIELKELILQMLSDESDDPTKVLDISLENLTELFKSNCIQVNVKKSRLH